MLITTQQLKILLSDYAKVSESEASVFVDALVRSIVQHVQKNESVTIQGLGTFVIVETQQGQLRRVAFHPEESLKEAVNAPFSFFEPVVLSPGKPVEKSIASVEPELPAAATESQEETLPDPDPIEVEPLPVVVDPEPVVEEPESIVAEPEPEPDPEPEPVAEEPDPIVEKQGTEPEPVVEEPNTKKRRHKKLSRFYPLTFLLIILVMAGMTYLGMQYFAGKVSEKESSTSEKLTRISEVSVTLDDTIQEDDLAESDTIPSSDAISPYWIDPATGQPRQVKVKEGETMSTISFDTYGSRHFWSYMYELNKDQLGHPNNRVVGKTLYLPNPDYYGIDGKDPESRKKAMYFGYEIYDRFNNTSKAK